MYLSVDIGGTKTLIAAFSRRGRVVRRRKFRTAQGSRDFLASLVANLKDFQKYKIRGVAVAIPGVVQKNCSVLFGNRNWKNIDLLTPIKNLFNCPIYFENDANLAALFEGFRLAGRTVFLTFSTGIGGGVVEKNRILPISNSFEPGHRIYTYQGETREWEDIAAASALEATYHVDYATSLRKKAQLKDIAARIALGLPDIIDSYQPKQIILGGPMGKVFKLYAKYLPPEIRKKCRRPKRPLESVIYGGFIYLRQKEQS